MSLVTPVGLDDSRHHVVRRTVVSALVITAATTAAMLIALVFFADHGALVLKAYFGALALLLSVRLINIVPASAFGDGAAAKVRRRRRMDAPQSNWPADLFEMQDRVSLSTVSEFDYQVRLRSYLRDLAAQRLAARWNVDLNRQPDQAKSRLGDELWNEIDGAADPVGRRDAPGPSLARLRALIEGLERI